MWNYDKSEIVLPVGAKLDIYLTSADVVHGFNIDKKAVNLMAVPGQVTVTSVTFDDPGTYPIICHEYCGANHQSMKGAIQVRPASDIMAAIPSGISSNQERMKKTGGEL
jgi:cytochrome c oxidase subunit 2